MILHSFFDIIDTTDTIDIIDTTNTIDIFRESFDESPRRE